MQKIAIIAIVALTFSPLFYFDSSNTKDNYEENLFSNEPSIENSISDEITSKSLIENYNQGVHSKYFTENRGQVGNDYVKYYIQGHGVWFTDSSVVFQLIEPSEVKGMLKYKFPMPYDISQEMEEVKEVRKSAVVQLQFSDCNNVIPVGKEELPHKSNFFYGNDSSNWCTNVPNYREIVYKNLYDNIDLKYYFNEEGLKYDFMVRPGGNPDDIMIKTNNINDLSIDSNGDILIETELNNIFDKDLFVYQEYDGRIQKMEANFKLLISNGYGFEILTDFNKNETLIIDPMIYSTYIGGANNDSINDIAIDETGNAYLTGVTHSSNFPVTMGSYNTSFNGWDIFVTKLNGDGTSLIYSTFIGGSYIDHSSGIAVDINGSAYITGWTWSQDFPTTLGAYGESHDGLYSDVIVSKLAPGGNNLNYSTFIGGNSQESATDIVLDDQGNAYITGSAFSTYPITPGVYSYIGTISHVIISKLNANGTDLIYSTIIGPIWAYGNSIALDNENNICITGIASSKFPTTPGAYRESITPGYVVFVLKMNANMTKLLYSTFTGNRYFYWDGLSPDILVDSEGSVIITGPTNVTNFATTSDAYDGSYNGVRDILILKFNFDLSSLLYATYLGGSEEDTAYDSTLDRFDNVIITGSTNSSDFPVLEGGYDTGYNGGFDVFITKLNLTHSELRYSSYIGGNNDEFGCGIDAGDKGYVYLAGASGPGFPTTQSSFDPTFNGGFYDAFAFKISPISLPCMIDLNVSESVVYRSHSIELYSNATDFQDNEWGLTPYFEYLGPGQPNWSVNLLDAPIYINERWQSTFTIPVNTTLGYYDFRVRYNDTDAMWSLWKYLNGSLRVLNNPPEMDHFDVSKDTVEIGESFHLFVNGTDVEDILQELTFELEYKHTDDTLWDPLEFEAKKLVGAWWEYNITFDDTIDYGYYDLRAMVYDSDLDYSEWCELNDRLLVNPAKPNIKSISLSKHEIYRKESVDVYINCSDADSIADDLFVELQYLPASEGTWHELSADYYETRWEAYIVSKKSWTLGIYNFRARVTDLEDNISPWFDLNDSLMVLNNIPEIKSVTGIPKTMYRGESASISIDAKDVENLESDLEIELEFRITGEQDWISNYLSPSSYLDYDWQFELTLPDNALLGLYSFRVHATDLDNDWSDYIYLNETLEVVNSLPEVLAFYQEPLEVFRTEGVHIYADGWDLETAKENLICSIYYQEPHSFTWFKLPVEYNESSMEWFSELITTKDFVIGNYSFNVQFMDSDGVLSSPFYSNRSVWVWNNLPVISKELDDIDVGSDPVTISLTDYGSDIETSKRDLIWKVDSSSINTMFFTIDTKNLDNQGITIYPAKSKNGKGDITLILMDADRGQTIKTDITVIVDSRIGDDTEREDDSTVSKLVKDPSYILIYILIIIIIIIGILFFLHRRKKKRTLEDEQIKEEEEVDEASTELEVEALQPEGETTEPLPETPTPTPVPVVEGPEVPTPVPMPVEEAKPQLPAPTQDTSAEKPETPLPEPKIGDLEKIEEKGKS